MAIMRWDPFGEMLKMQRDMDRIFSRMDAGGARTAGPTAWMPKINVKQTGDDVAVHVELAGIRPDDVDIEVTDGVLTIRGERKAASEREGEGWLIRESSFGSFERSMVLPEGVDPASIRAEFRDGMLEVHIPKALEEAKPKTTKISIGGGQAAMGGGEPGGGEPAGGGEPGGGSGSGGSGPGGGERSGSGSGGAGGPDSPGGASGGGGMEPQERGAGGAVSGPAQDQPAEGGREQAE